jgi:hypothetical protein
MENKKENFKRISENRTTKILTLLSQFKNLSNSSFYQYTDDEIEKIFNVIEGEAKKTKEYLLKKNNKKNSKKLEL